MNQDRARELASETFVSIVGRPPTPVELELLLLDFRLNSDEIEHDAWLHDEVDRLAFSRNLWRAAFGGLLLAVIVAVCGSTPATAADSPLSGAHYLTADSVTVTEYLPETIRFAQIKEAAWQSTAPSSATSTSTPPSETTSSTITSTANEETTTPTSSAPTARPESDEAGRRDLPAGSSTIRFPIEGAEWVGIEGDGWSAESPVTEGEGRDGMATETCARSGPATVTVWRVDGTIVQHQVVCP